MYFLDLDAPGGPDETVLKATTPGDHPMAHAEARLLGILAAETDVPVPEVYGAVDDHPDLPTPYLLMERLPGETIYRPEMVDLPADALRWIARESGRHLADLHRIRDLEGFGSVGPNLDRPLAGGRPSGDLGSVRVADPTADWPTWLHQAAENGLSDLESTRFADLVSEVGPVVHDRIDDLGRSPPGTAFEPTLAHVDNQIANLLLDRDRRSITGVIDWSFTLAATPAYDLAFAERSLAGGPWWYVPAIPDRESLVREALLEGYRETGSEAAIGEFREHGDLYRLFACLFSAFHFEDRLRMDGASESAIEAAARRHRAVFERYR